MIFIKSTLSKDFFWRIIFTLSKQGFLFFLFLAAAKNLSIDIFGIYNYIYSFIFLLILLSDFGISTATSKHIAENPEKEKNKKVLSSITFLVLITSLLLFFLILIFGKSYFGNNFALVLLLSPLMFLVPVTSIFDGIYRGMHSFKKTAIYSLITSLFSIPLTLLLTDKFGLIGVISSQLLFYFILFIIYTITYDNHSFSIDKKIIKTIGRYSILYGIAVISYQLFARTDILFLGHYGFVNQIATYELINKFFSILIIPFTLFGQVIAPRFTELFYIKKDYVKIYSNLKSATIITILISGLAGIILYFLFPYFIKSFLPQYNNEIFYNIFIFSIFIFCINIMTATIDHGMIVPTGYAKLMTKIYLNLAILNIILNPLFIKLFGYIGSIYSTLICTILMFILLRIYYFREIKKIILLHK